MAIQNHPALYSGGNVALDSSPTTNLYGRLLQYKQAKMDALDQYDRNRINSVNAAGVRDQDREGFDQALATIQNYYGENKDKIRKANTPEAYQYEKMFRDVSSYINQSKERTAKQDAAVKLHQDVFKKDGIIPDAEDGTSFIDDLAANDKPLNDPTGRSFELNKWLGVSQKPFNLQSHLAKYKDIAREPKPARYEKIPTDPLKQMEIVDEVFTPKSKEVIANRAATDYHSSLGFHRQVDNEFNSPGGREKLAKLYSEEYGKPPESIEDYATAYQMSIMQPVVTKAKPVDNKSALMDRTENFKKVMQAQGFENAKVIAAIRNSYSNMNYENRRAAVGGDVDAFIDDQKANANEGNWITGDERTLKVSPIILESFKDANSGGYTPTEIRLMPDGNYKLVGEQGKFPTQVITPAEYKAGIVNKVLNTTTKINQVKQPSNTPETRLPKDIKQTKITPKKKINW
jgi:hypothetical protein